MSERGTADLIADLLLRCYREPMRYRGQAVRQAHGLANLNVVLRLALGRPVDFSNPALQGPAVAAELERAAAFHIQQGFFREGASHYEILGLAPGASPDSVRENFRLLMQLVHPDRHGADTEWPEGYAARANRAYSVLKGAKTRADYDRQQAAARAQEAVTRGQQAGGRAPPAGVRASSATTRTHVPARSGSARQPLPAPVLPEWLTDGVSGFMLRHPRFTVFAGLISVSAAIIGTVIWPEQESALNAASTYTVPETVKRTNLNRPRAAEPATVERVAGFEPPLPSVAPERPAATTTPATMPPSLIPAQPPASAKLAPAPPTEVARAVPQDARVPAPAQMRIFETSPAAPPGPPPMPAVATRSAPTPIPVTPTSAPVVVAAPMPAVAVSPVPVLSPSPAPSSPPPVVMLQAANSPGAVASIPVAAIPAVPERNLPATAPPPGSAEVESLIAMFVSSYEKGTLPVFANLFDDDAQTNSQRGRIAIRSEYERFFQSTAWRRMKIVQIRWQAVGDRAEASGLLTLSTGWPDGRETEQRVSVNMDLVRHGGRLVIAKFSHEPR